jgi:hypothetical protein
MKRIWQIEIVLGLAAMAVTAGAQTATPSSGSAVTPGTQMGAQDESLGAYARSVRKDKTPASPKKFDNDNLPTDDKLSVVGKADAAPADAQSASNADQSKAGDDSSKKSESQSAEERQKANEEWKSKIASQRDKIDLLTRELDVVQREYKLRAAAMYADVGNRLRNSAEWDKEDAQYKQQIADKQKSLDDAKQQLDNLQEQARKDGVPSAMRE